MKASKIYAAMYNPMIEESCFGVISLHKTRKGAEMAMEFHKAVELKEWKEMYKDHRAPYTFGRFEKWSVVEMEVLE